MANDPIPPEAGTSIPIHSSNLPEAKILADLFSIKNDMQLVVNTLNRLISKEGDEIAQQSYFSTALITYRRCFTTGVRNGLIHRDVEGLQNNSGDLHGYLRGLADKLIAHSVNPFEKVRAGVVVRENRVIGTSPLNIRLVNLPDDRLLQWGRLITEVFNTVLKPRIIAAETALFEAARQLPIEEVTKMPLLELSPFVLNEEANKRRD